MRKIDVTIRSPFATRVDDLRPTAVELVRMGLAQSHGLDITILDPTNDESIVVLVGPEPVRPPAPE